MQALRIFDRSLHAMHQVQSCMHLLPRRIHFIDNVLGIVVAAKEGRQDGAIVRRVAAGDTSRLSLPWFDGMGDFDCIGGPAVQQ